MTEKDILNFIYEDKWMMEVLRVARTLDLPDWMIGAGFVRNKVWDVLHGYNKEVVDTDDIDLIYFDLLNTDENQEKEYDKQLKEAINLNWSSKNQSRMHLKNNEEPYTSSTHALSHWVDTPTCIAVTLDKNDKLHLVAPYGIDDLVNLNIRPISKFTKDENIGVYKERIVKKKWIEKWPKLKILYK